MYREVNQCANALVNVTLFLDVPFKTFDLPPGKEVKFRIKATLESF